MSLSLMQWPACSMLIPPSTNTAARYAYVAHPRAQDALHALRLPLVGESIELAGNIRIEERREGGVAVDQVRMMWRGMR